MNDSRREELRKLTKRINQRLVRAERDKITFLKQYEDIQSLIISSGISSKSRKGLIRFKESVNKLSDEQVKRALIFARRAETFKDIVGKESREKLKITQNKFYGHFDDLVTNEDINDYLVFQKNENYRVAMQFIDSDQIMELIQINGSKKLDHLIDDYIERTPIGSYDRYEFVNFLYGGGNT